VPAWTQAWPLDIPEDGWLPYGTLFDALIAISTVLRYAVLALLLDMAFPRAVIVDPGNKRISIRRGLIPDLRFHRRYDYANVSGLALYSKSLFIPSTVCYKLALILKGYAAIQARRLLRINRQRDWSFRPAPALQSARLKNLTTIIDSRWLA